jgi:circadian clock protein KaiB
MTSDPDEVHPPYLLRLYVTGQTPRSRAAIQNLQKICEDNLPHRYTLEIIDIYQNPELCREQQIVAAPTLIKSLPLPLRRIIGDLSDQEKVLVGLDLKPRSTL